VDPATTVAVLGIETNYGSVAGRYPVVDATLSRACLNLGSSERKQHFFDALWLLQEGTVRPETFRGSWAGAFGLTQFMPGTFRRYMRDGPDSPPADIVGSMADALATTARYLRGLGWTEGLRWGVEVRVPPELARLDAQESGHGCLSAAKLEGRCRSAGDWSRAGVTRVDGSPLVQRDPAAGLAEPATPAALLMPAGPQGPAWLVTPNYQAIWRYNRADTYALAIGLLSDALRGLPPPQVAWPTDDPGLSRAEFRQLQQLLVQGGHCDVLVDGAEGPRTSAAIRAEEERLGWPATGRAGSKLLAALAASSTGASACPATR
jgi:glucose-6-phosphate 1-epimerase